MLSVKRDSWLTFLVSELIGVSVFIASADYPIVKGQPFSSSPAFYPRFLAGCMIFLGLLHLSGNLLQGRLGAPAQENRSLPSTNVTYRFIVGFLFLSVLSVMAVKFIGLILSGFLLTFFSVLLFRASLKWRDAALSLLYCIALTAFIYLIFVVFVGVQMPRASLFT